MEDPRWERVRELNRKWAKFENRVRQIERQLKTIRYDGLTRQDWDPWSMGREPAPAPGPEDIQPLSIEDFYSPLPPPALPAIEWQELGLRLDESEYPDGYGLDGERVVRAEVEIRKGLVRKALEVKRAIQSARETHERILAIRQRELQELRLGNSAGDPLTAARSIVVAHLKHGSPSARQGEFRATVDMPSRAVIIDLEFLGYSCFKFSSEYIPASRPPCFDVHLRPHTAGQQFESARLFLAFMIYRAACLAARFANTALFDTIVVNVGQSKNRTAGELCQEKTIASMELPVESLASAIPKGQDLSSLFERFRSVITPSFEFPSQVEPIRIADLIAGCTSRVADFNLA